MGSTSSMLMHYLDSALLSRWSYEAQGPTAPYGGQSILRIPKQTREKEKRLETASLFRRLQYGWDESLRTRSAGTPWAISHIPPFYKDDSRRLPTKAEFVYWSLRRCVICLILVDVVCYMGRDTSQNALIFNSSRIALFSRLQNVTAEELILRVIASLLHWIVTTLYLHAIYDGVAAAVIGLDFGRMERWPPLYGSVTELYSVRQFWG